MKSKNSKIKKTISKKIPLGERAYYSLRRQLYVLQLELVQIREGAWDLKNLLRERDWEASEKKMPLENRHSFILYADRASILTRQLQMFIDKLNVYSLKDDK